MSAATSEDVLQVLQVVRQVQTGLDQLRKDVEKMRKDQAAHSKATAKTLAEIQQTVSVLETDVLWTRGQVRQHDQETTVLAARIDALEDNGTAE